MLAPLFLSTFPLLRPLIFDSIRSHSRSLLAFRSGSASTNSSGCIGSPHVLAGSQSSIESHTGNNLSTIANGGSTSLHGTHQPHWSSPGTLSNGPNHQPSSSLANQAFNAKDPRRISDFQTLCLTFPDFSSSHLQALFGKQ